MKDSKHIIAVNNDPNAQVFRISDLKVIADINELLPRLIEEIRQYRQETKVPIYFTLDAGPNVHVLYPQDYQVEVSRFINERLLPLTESNFIINDRVGSGPKQL